MKGFLLLLLCISFKLNAQIPLDVSRFNKNGESRLTYKNNVLNISWPAGTNMNGVLVLDFAGEHPLFKKITINNKGVAKQIATDLDPAFILTVGKRTLSPASGGWDVFFDKVPTRPYKAYNVTLNKLAASVESAGSRTIIKIDSMRAASFLGALEITLYNGSPLINIAAVLSTNADSTAILYDAGLINKSQVWKKINWADTDDQMMNAVASTTDSSKNVAVKYRTIIGESGEGSLAIFPPPHQYFYPLDEAFNLKFTWYGNNYRNLLPGFGIGIRQDLEGDKRFVPWFNAPPSTKQRLNFFCLLGVDNNTATTLQQVKKFTHNDGYLPLPGYKTMASHFHNEFIMNVVLAGKPVPEVPNFVKVFKGLGVDIVHLAEFHYTAHSKGPDDQRLKELKALFGQCKRLSDKNFLLLPGEEPNEFFGGHWLAFFPKPVYWIMSRKQGVPFVTSDPFFGKVYRVNDKEDMLKLLQEEHGLAWTAHPRTKGSVGYPDAYKNENFFKSDRFFGAAWKAIPADLSTPTLSRRVLNLMDDMNNWGITKHAIAEADLFSIEPQNEMYAHLNVNYLKLDKLPSYEDGWQPVLNAMTKGNFFSGTGEILLPFFTVNNKEAGDTALLPTDGNAKIVLDVQWTFPLNFAEIISGDGKQVYHEKVNLNDTKAFGKKRFTFPVNLKNRTWVRVEVWDAAVNGAFSQTVWLK